MITVEAIFKQGINLKKMFAIISREVLVERDNKRVDYSTNENCRSEIMRVTGHIEAELFDVYNRYFRMTNTHAHPIKRDKKLINDLENIFLNTLRDWGLEEAFIAIGYCSTADHGLAVIPKQGWAFSEMDSTKDRETVYFNGQEYKKVRYLPLQEQKESLPPEEFEEIKAILGAASGSDRDIAGKVKNIAKKQGHTDTKTRNCQLHIFIWKVYQSLDKPTAQRLWKEIENNYLKYDTDNIIQEVKNDTIFWSSIYGNESELSRKSFDSTLSKLKRTPPF